MTRKELPVPHLAEELLDAAKALVEFGDVAVKRAHQEREVFEFHGMIHRMVMVRGEVARSSSTERRTAQFIGMTREMIIAG